MHLTYHIETSLTLACEAHIAPGQALDPESVSSQYYNAGEQEHESTPSFARLQYSIPKHLFALITELVQSRHGGTPPQFAHNEHLDALEPSRLATETPALQGGFEGYTINPPAAKSASHPPRGSPVGGGVLPTLSRSEHRSSVNRRLSYHSDQSEMSGPRRADQPLVPAICKRVREESELDEHMQDKRIKLFTLLS